jgi:hypothetical protein
MTPKFRVRSFPRSSFADQSANDAFANVPNVSQVTSLFWPIASRFRDLEQRIPEFRVRSFQYSSFADQSAGDAHFVLIVQPSIYQFWLYFF